MRTSTPLLGASTQLPRPATPGPFAAAAILALLLHAPAAGQSPPPNVLVIVLDDLGTERLDFYGQSATYAVTPSLDLIRQGSVLFTSAYAQPLCSPTRACALTGRYAFRTGMGDITTLTSQSYPLPDSEVTVAEVLKAGFPGQPAQYTSAVFGKWHLARPLDYQHPVRNGFDYFQGLPGNVGPRTNTDHYKWVKVTATPASEATKNVGTKHGPFDESTYSASVLRLAAQGWINERTGPFFAWVAFSPPHAPMQVPPLTLLSPATQATITTLGLAAGADVGGTPNAKLCNDWAIEAIDTEIGRLLAGINPQKLANTTIVILGDNGTAEPVVLPPFQASHAKGSVYETGTRVPLLVAGPKVSVPNSTCSGLVSALDILDTIVALTGAQGAPATDGTSFLHMVVNPLAPSNRTEVLVQRFRPNGPFTPDPNNPPAGLTIHDRGITDGTTKYIRKLIPTTGTYQEEVYDLSVDPLELNDLFPAYVAGNLPPISTQTIAGLIQKMTQVTGF